MNILLEKSNSIGIIASSLCLIHCLVTPFIFIASVCAESCCDTTPNWWKGIDILFLIISFFAVYHSSKVTTKKIMTYSLWLFLIGLFLVIFNEYVQFFSLPQNAIYYPSLGLVILHFYNRKFCHCKEDRCCIEK